MPAGRGGPTGGKHTLPFSDSGKNSQDLPGWGIHQGHRATEPCPQCKAADRPGGMPINCASRMMTGVINGLEPEVINTDQLFEFDKSLFGIEEMPPEQILPMRKSLPGRSPPHCNRLHRITFDRTSIRSLVVIEMAFALQGLAQNNCAPCAADLYRINAIPRTSAISWFDSSSNSLRISTER